jgi:hypothetical protein
MAFPRRRPEPEQFGAAFASPGASEGLVFPLPFRV